MKLKIYTHANLVMLTSKIKKKFHNNNQVKVYDCVISCNVGLTSLITSITSIISVKKKGYALLYIIIVCIAIMCVVSSRTTAK